jgi:D-sedoheptulose 7-phosphate isomerase
MLMSDANTNLTKRNTLDDLFEKSQNKEEYIAGYARYLSLMLANLNTKQVAAFIDTLMTARNNGKKIFFIGNGGSAATASHFANDLLAGMRLTAAQKPFKAVALTDNNALMTAIGNDDGYDYIFSKQLDALMEPGDVVVAISASGNSPNLVKAIELARSRGNTSVGLVGFDGGKMMSICSQVVHIPATKGEYGPVEDMHMILDHLVTTYIYRAVRASNN